MEVFEISLLCAFAVHLKNAQRDFGSLLTFFTFICGFTSPLLPGLEWLGG